MPSPDPLTRGCQTMGGMEFRVDLRAAICFSGTLRLRVTRARSPGPAGLAFRGHTALFMVMSEQAVKGTICEDGARRQEERQALGSRQSWLAASDKGQGTEAGSTWL